MKERYVGQQKVLRIYRWQFETTSREVDTRISKNCAVSDTAYFFYL